MGIGEEQVLHLEGRSQELTEDDLKAMRSGDDIKKNLDVTYLSPLDIEILEGKLPIDYKVYNPVDSNEVVQLGSRILIKQTLKDGSSFEEEVVVLSKAAFLACNGEYKGALVVPYSSPLGKVLLGNRVGLGIDYLVLQSFDSNSYSTVKILSLKEKS